MSAKTDQRTGLLRRLLRSVVGFVARRPRLSLWMVMIPACAAVGLTVLELRLRTSRADLIDPDTEFSRAWTEYSEVFGSDSDFVVVAQTGSPNPQLLQQVLTDLGERLQREPDVFSNVLYRIDQRTLRRKGLQFLSEAELTSAIRTVDRYAPVIAQKQWDRIRVDQHAASLAQELQTQSGVDPSSNSAYASAERFAISLDRFLALLQRDPNGRQLDTASFQSPWPQIIGVDIEATAEDAEVAYLMNPERTVGLLHVQPVASDSEFNANEHSIRQLRNHIQEIVAEYQPSSPDLKLSLTGVPVLEHDELARSGRDMLKAAVIAFVCVGLLLTFGFRTARHPLLLLLTVVVALCWTFALATLAIGHLNILSICFAAILIGLGVDFGIHFLSRYLHLRQELYELQEALELTAESVGPGILTSALTTALAFGSAALTGFPGLAELGIIAGGGILICAFTTFTFLPALISLSDAEVEIDELPQPLNARWFRAAVAGFPLVVIGVSVLAIGGISSQAFYLNNQTLACRVGYDANLLRLHDATMPSVQAEKTLTDAADESLLYAVAVAHSRDEALQLGQQFAALPSVRRVGELASRLPDPPSAANQQLIRSLNEKLRNLPQSYPDFAALSPGSVGRQMEVLLKELKRSSTSEARTAAALLDHFLDSFAELKPARQAAFLEAYQNLMAASLLKEFDQAARASELAPVGMADLPAEWRHRYLRADNDQEAWLLKVYPREDIWNDVELAAFVRDLRTVKADVTGVPVQNYESVTQLHRSYKAIALYSLGIISLFLLLDFLRPGQKLLTLVPPMVIVGLIGYTMFRRAGEVNVDLLVILYLGMVGFVAAVLDIRNLRDTLLALLPPLAGGIILLGIMALAGFHFNPLNLIVLPLVLGIGVDNGIHMVHDCRRQVAAAAESYVPSADTLSGVLFTSLTSIVGFSSLLVSGHHGLFSVGAVLSIGVACCMAVALIPLPAVLTLVARHQPASMEPVLLRTPKSADAASDDSNQSSKKQQQPQQQKKAA
ncbi:MAG: MMPL family transporter [Planctomycetaceae bacterium]